MVGLELSIAAIGNDIRYIKPHTMLHTNTDDSTTSMIFRSMVIFRFVVFLLSNNDLKRLLRVGFTGDVGSGGGTELDVDMMIYFIASQIALQSLRQRALNMSRRPAAMTIRAPQRVSFDVYLCGGLEN